MMTDLTGTVAGTIESAAYTAAGSTGLVAVTTVVTTIATASADLVSPRGPVRPRLARFGSQR